MNPQFEKYLRDAWSKIFVIILKIFAGGCEPADRGAEQGTAAGGQPQGQGGESEGAAAAGEEEEEGLGCECHLHQRHQDQQQQQQQQQQQHPVQQRQAPRRPGEEVWRTLRSDQVKIFNMQEKNIWTD